MSATTLSTDVLAVVKEVSTRPYRDQAVFYLNAFWAEGGAEQAEDVWSLTQAFVKEDNVKGKDGNELNPIQAFHLLQTRNETMTALELKAQLRKVDIDANGEMSLAEYLLFVYERDVAKFATNPQGDAGGASTQMKAIEAKLEELNQQYAQLTVQLEEQKVAEASAKKAEADAIAAEAKAKEEEAAAVTAEVKATADARVAADAEAAATAAAEKLKAAEEEVRKVEEEARSVDAALKAEQDAFDNECARLDALTKDETVGIVKRNTAVQQLASLKSSDPLPLQKAKITQEAVVRRVTRARQAAEAETAIAAAAAAQAADARAAADAAAVAATAARESAVASRQQAEVDREAAVAARAAAEEATKAVEASIESIKATSAALEAELEELKKAPTVPHGAIWFAEREITEKKKYLPQRFQ